MLIIVIYRQKNIINSNLLIPFDSDVDHWIGLREGELDCVCGNNATSCEICRASWIWDDGTPMTYMNWFEDRPWPGRDCGILRHGGAYCSSGCSNGKPYICQCEYLCCFRFHKDVAIALHEIRYIS